MGFFSNLFKGEPRRCQSCHKQDVQDALVIGGGSSGSLTDYCRTDLMREFEKAFLAFDHPVIVCHPTFVSRYTRSMYPYYPIDEMASFDFQKEAIARVTEIVASIAGASCKECQMPASVAYYLETEYDDSGPLLESLPVTEGTYLCRPHAFAKIKTDLTNHTEAFAEGIFAPYVGPGIFVSTYL